jgi:serine/threonine protein kinase
MRRLERERQMLGRLEHPNIARLLDGGSSQDGSPYLVLEYVVGTPLDEFCSRHDLGMRQRLELFRGVCRAVSFAHQRLVVHRDLKPANILVTDAAVPVVLDFGLAKLAAASLASALDPTTTGHRMLTPDYASPEQVTGVAVTPAVDVYALGVILYELLTGARPHRFKTWSMAEIVDVICRGVVTSPRSVAKSNARPDISAALEGIVMKALAKEPADRYVHVAELDDDLQRHLAGRPIPGIHATP